MTAAADTAAGPAVPWRGDDFPTWLNPMLVRELRQGIQSGAFAWTFVGLQVVMFLVMATTLVGRDAGFPDGTIPFWVPVTLAVAIVVPLRGLGAVSAERSGNNLDLVRLTHLSARRIVTGKWLAIVAQSALLATAALPYLVLRYFFGGVNVVAELVSFGWMFAGAMLVAAAAVAASTRPVRERIALVILLFVAGNLLLQAATFGAGPGGGWTPSLSGLAFAGLYTVLLLEYAASAIAPPAANHAAAKRSVAIAIGAAWVATAVLGGRDVFPIVAWATVIPLVAVAVEALCERPSALASIHAPFVRRGVAGRAAAFVLTPGWATGLVLVTLLGTACGGAMVAYASRFDPADVPAFASLASLAFAAVVYPLPVVVPFLDTPRRHLVYGVVQVACTVVLALSGMAQARTGEPALAPVALFPPAAFLWALGANQQARTTLAVAAALVTVVVYALVMVPWLRAIAATRHLLAAAADPADAAVEVMA